MPEVERGRDQLRIERGCDQRSSLPKVVGGRQGVGQTRIMVHRRNTGAMLASPRCGARTRSGTSCRAPAVSGKRRCRMHGGAKGTGAPRGNQNALKHGAFTKKAIQQRSEMRELFRQARKLLNELGD